MANVYIINKKETWDLTSATSYGKLITVFPEVVPHVFDISRLSHELRIALNGITINDHILLGGNLLPNSLAVAIALTKLPTVNLLIYDTKTYSYNSRTIARHHINIGEVL